MLTLHFKLHEQDIKVDGGIQNLASDILEQVDCEFSFEDNETFTKWSEFDYLAAIFSSNRFPAEERLIINGRCAFPEKLLTDINTVRCNVIGVTVDGDDHTTRLSTFMIDCLKVKQKIKIMGKATPVSPTLFDQYIQIVRGYIDEVKDMENTLPLKITEWISEHREELKGDPGPQGESFTYEDFTEEQLKELTGPEGPRGKSGVYLGTEEPRDPEVNVWIDPS